MGQGLLEQESHKRGSKKMPKKKLAKEMEQEEQNNLNVKNVDSSILMSNSELFQPIMGEWNTVLNEENNLVGEVEIKCFILMGLTLGHCMRRISLGLSSSFSVVAIKVSNNDIPPSHAFDSIIGIVEDLHYLHYNIKGIKVKVKSKEKEVDYFFLSLHTSKPGPVYARDIKIENEHVEVEIVNPDHLVCNLDVGSNLKIDMLFRKGFGYASEEENQRHLNKSLMTSLGEGWFYVGTQFSSGVLSFIANVTEMTGGSVAYDSLKIKIVTDGRITPEEVLEESFKILHDQIPAFCCEFSKSKEIEPSKEDEKNKIPLTEIGLKTSTINQLKRQGIHHVGELLKYTPQSLSLFRGFGNTRLADVVERLAAIGASLQIE